MTALQCSRESEQLELNWENIVKRTVGCIVVIGALAIPLVASAQHSHPTGLLGQEAVGAGNGRWMVGYEFMYERMAGNRDGRRAVSEADILQNYFAAPTEMTMQMHMGTAMYAPNDRATLMVMVPYLVKSMDHVTVDGDYFNERTTGVGDVEVHATGTLYAHAESPHRWFLNVGVGLPSGSINQRMNDMRLEYPMQLGAGTVSLTPALSYVGSSGSWSWGTDLVPTFRVGKNDNGYRLGDQYRFDLWLIRQISEGLSLSARADARRVENIHGADPELDPEDEPTKNPALQGSRRLALLGGLNYRLAGTGHQLFIEAGAPAYQSLDGPQLKTTFVGRVNWQWHFR